MTVVKEKEAVMEKTIQAQQVKDSEMEKTIHQLQNTVTDLRHVEHGVLDCGNNGNWNDGPVAGATINSYNDWDTVKTLHITKSFTTVYKTPPVVFLSTRFRYINKDMNNRFGTFLKDVNTHNFTMFCGSDDEADDRIADLEVSWISVPT